MYARLDVDIHRRISKHQPNYQLGHKHGTYILKQFYIIVLLIFIIIVKLF